MPFCSGLQTQQTNARMPNCVLCQYPYHTCGPPGTCPKCWYHNAMTDSDRATAKSLMERQAAFSDLEEAIDGAEAVLSKAVQTVGTLRFSRRRETIKIGITTDGKTCWFEKRMVDGLEGVKAIIPSHIRCWKAVGVTKEFAQALQTCLGVPVHV